MSRFGMLHNCDLSQEEDFRYAMESAELAYAETSASEPHNPDASADVIGGHESTPNVGYDASTSAETFETSDGGVSLQAKAAKAFLAASFSQVSFFNSVGGFALSPVTKCQKQIYPSTLGQPNSTPGNEISWGNESEEHTIWGYSVSSGSPGLYIGTQQAIPEAFMSDESLQRIIDINRMVEEDYVGGMDNPWSAVDTKVPNTIADQTNEAANFNDAAGLGDMGVMNGSWSVVGTEDSNTIAGGTNQDGVGIWQAWDEPANLMDHPHTTCLTEDEFAPLLGRFEPTQTLDYGVETRVFEQGEHTQSAEQIVSTQDVNQDEPEQAINSDNQAQNIDPSLAAPQTTAYTTLYSSYEAAMEAKAENGLVGGNAPVDDTIPVTAAEDRVVVGRLFQAISNTTNTRDWTPTDMTKKPKPPHALKKFMDGTYEREKVELLAWDILVGSTLPSNFQIKLTALPGRQNAKKSIDVLRLSSRDSGRKKK